MPAGIMPGNTRGGEKDVARRTEKIRKSTFKLYREDNRRAIKGKHKGNRDFAINGS